MRAWNYLQKTSGSLLNTEIIKQTHKIMMEHRDGKDVLAGKYIMLSVFAGYHISKEIWKTQLLGHETKEDDPILAATNLFGKVINIHTFEHGNGRICRSILAHIFIQMKCCLFPVILSFFHRRGIT